VGPSCRTRSNREFRPRLKGDDQQLWCDGLDDFGIQVIGELEHAVQQQSVRGAEPLDHDIGVLAAPGKEIAHRYALEPRDFREHVSINVPIAGGPLDRIPIRRTVPAAVPQAGSKESRLHLMLEGWKVALARRRMDDVFQRPRHTRIRSEPEHIYAAA
jgi:hypothetical protein